jgi:YhcH/YjgK/YiaL family protein
MIVDTLDNISLYKNISNDIFSGLIFLSNAKPDIDLGLYTINNNVKAIVSQYETIEGHSQVFESHRHVIDIQYPIIGLERVLWSPIQDMDIDTPYNEEKDCIYYKNPHSQQIHVDIGSNIFAIMFECDGHSPQHSIHSSELIKKITVKVNI